jgi:NADPH-dependent curcumin reductase CurA
MKSKFLSDLKKYYKGFLCDYNIVINKKNRKIKKELDEVTPKTLDSEKDIFYKTIGTKYRIIQYK